jgi:hypothetical protein
MAEPNTAEAQALLRQLAEGRERLRAERAAAKPQLDEADRLIREARETRRRVRKSAARYLKRFRRKAADATAPIQAARAEIARQQDELQAAFAKLTADRERFQTEADDSRSALAAAWELLGHRQAQFSNERDERDAELSRLFQLLETRERETNAAADRLRRDRAATESELTILRAEIAGLDKRAANARLQLQELEQSRAKAIADRVVGLAHDPVPLAVTGDIPAYALSAFEQREAELFRERRELDTRRKELDLLAEHLTDGRRLLAEQIEQVANAREAWQAAESRTVDELEELARAVEFREAMLAEREETATRQDDNRRERERELWKYQTTLEQWNSLLVERESRFLADREQAELGLAARRGRLADREAELDGRIQTWDEENARRREDVLDAIVSYREQSDECRAAVLECEKLRRQTQEQAAQLASWLLAAEQQYAESARHPEHARASQRVVVLRKRWEGRFARSLRQLDERLARLHAESDALSVRQASFHKLAAEVTERERRAALAERHRDRNALLAKQLPDDEPIVLAVADAWRRRTDAEIDKLRRLAEHAADALLDADAKDDIVPLRSADAA